MSKKSSSSSATSALPAFSLLPSFSGSSDIVFLSLTTSSGSVGSSPLSIIPLILSSTSRRFLLDSSCSTSPFDFLNNFGNFRT